MNKISRRSFLKGTASLAVMGVLGGCAEQGASPKGPEQSPEAANYNATSKTGLCTLDFSKMEKLTTDVAVIGGGGAGILRSDCGSAKWSSGSADGKAGNAWRCDDFVWRQDSQQEQRNSLLMA